MNNLPSFFAAFVAGVGSFLAPCILPLIPVYLSFLLGESVTAGGSKFKLFVRTVYFILGFSCVFVALAMILHAGMSFSKGMYAFRIKQIAGVLVVFLGAHMIFDFIPFLRMDAHIQITNLEKKSAGFVRSVLFGMLFAAGWTPCVGPILSVILIYAANADNSLHAMALLLVYSFGLGVPFIITALFLNQIKPLLDFLKRHSVTVKIICGFLIIVFGIAMIFGKI